MKYNYAINDLLVGYIDYTPRNDNVLFINYILIYKLYRGNNYSTIMFNNFINDLDYKKIQLIGMEDMERYNKLYNLYKSWGFKNIGKESIFSDNRGTFRRTLFEFITPNTALFE